MEVLHTNSFECHIGQVAIEDCEDMLERLKVKEIFLYAKVTFVDTRNVRVLSSLAAQFAEPKLTQFPTVQEKRNCRIDGH